MKSLPYLFPIDYQKFDEKHSIQFREIKDLKSGRIREICLKYFEEFKK
jgi:hypothetical protein